MQIVVTHDLAADLRAELARRQLRIYDVAPRVGLHPNHLGQILRGRRPLSVELAERISRAIRAEEVGDHGCAD
jgi:plasmid maintenance system antidote protein VapI